MITVISLRSRRTSWQAFPEGVFRADCCLCCRTHTIRCVSDGLEGLPCFVAFAGRIPCRPRIWGRFMAVRRGNIAYRNALGEFYVLSPVTVAMALHLYDDALSFHVQDKEELKHDD